MMPNLDRSMHDFGGEQKLFECDCGCKQQVTLYTDEDGDVWLHVISFVASFWQAVRWMWKERKVYRADLLIRASDLQAMRDQLDKHIQRMKQKQLDEAAKNT